MMFSSPNVRVFSHENSENAISRKPGQNAILRKPFTSIGVNSTPAKSPLHKQNVAGKKMNDKVACSSYHDKVATTKTEEVFVDDYMFSYRSEKDDFNDIWAGYSDEIFPQMVCNDIRNFCGATPKTPEPQNEFDIDSIFFTVSEPVLFIPEQMNASFDKLPEFEDSIESVGTPHIDFDEFNDSV
ncbi:unnamed protein product [Brassicogethes aeneus]|uniref:Uncharacterized protein n=1 Tax=Brassicogethes aeneus TaxID=1431903 RepID=A0A9P0B4F6_BRAAE|nr:unnamed protein product [Brassicogethes aeneus]